MRVGINARLALRRGIALSLIRPANPNKVLGENPLVEDVHIRSQCIVAAWRSVRTIRTRRDCLPSRQTTGLALESKVKLVGCQFADCWWPRRACAKSCGLKRYRGVGNPACRQVPEAEELGRLKHGGLEVEQLGILSGATRCPESQCRTIGSTIFVS